MPATLPAGQIKIGLFGLQALQAIAPLPQVALLHDLAHGVDLPCALSPGRIDELVAHGTARAAALADDGIDPDTLDVERWWGLLNDAIQGRQKAAASTLAELDGANPQAPSRV